MAVNLSIVLIFQFLILILLDKIAKKFNFLDYPSERKKHSKPTPYVGGLALSFGFLFLYYSLNINQLFINLILLSAFLMSLIGLLDDKFDLNPFVKLFLQSIPVVILISKGLYLSDLGEYEIIGKIGLGYYAKFFTFLCCLLILNSFNYIDGIDGLLATLFINIFMSFSLICYFLDKIYISQILIFFIFPVIVFFIFNISLFKLPKIFLGDSGSNYLGFITGFMMILLYIEFSIEPTILIWPVALIIFDFLSTSIIRIIKKNKLFQTGKDHIHYQLMKKFNLDIKEINLTLNIINIFFTFLGLSIFYFFGAFYSIIIFIIVFFLYLRFKVYLVS